MNKKYDVRHTLTKLMFECIEMHNKKKERDNRHSTSRDENNMMIE